MLRLSAYLPFVAAMALVVVASNILVQFPVQGFVGGLALADILTWGAFTYPFAFLVTDLANRRYGPAVARARGVHRLHGRGHLLDRRAAAAVFARPDRIWRDRRPAGAHRRRLGRGIPDRATARRHRLQPPAAAELVARAGVRVAGRLGARHGDLLLASPSRRCLPSSARKTRSRWSRRRCSACFARRGAALDFLGGRRPLREAADRGLRADPLPADRRPLECSQRWLKFLRPVRGRRTLSQSSCRMNSR